MMKKTAAVLAILFLLVACGRSETDRTPGAAPLTSQGPTAPAPEPTPQPTDSAPSTSSKQLEVWFTFGESLFVAHHEVDTGPAVGRAAIEELLARPTDFEANAGVGTAVPPGTGLLDLDISGGIATVDLSEEYGSTGSGTLGESLAVAQVVYTLTQFPTVSGVKFKMEGAPLEMTPGHGIDLSEPQRRKDWDQYPYMPSILVTSPTMGEHVSSPVTVTGTADVFEATVQMRILDAQGKRLARAFTTATCGTGCRGDFSHELTYSIDSEQHGVIEVWWDSPEDGSREDVVKIAVTLTP